MIARNKEYINILKSEYKVVFGLETDAVIISSRTNGIVLLPLLDTYVPKGYIIYLKHTRLSKK